MIDYITESGALYVTNSVSHAQKLLKKGMRVFLIGGELKAVTEAIVGAEAVEGLKKVSFYKRLLRNEPGRMQFPAIRRRILQRLL